VDPETRRELEATVAARRELGPEHEQELVDAFLERIDRRLAERTQRAPSKPAGGRPGDWSLFTLIFLSMGIGIPLTEKAVLLGGGLGLIAVLAIWAAIVALNAVYSQR
jgi:hypothetical protein